MDSLDPTLDPIEPSVSADLLHYAAGATAVKAAEELVVGSRIELELSSRFRNAVRVRIS